MKRKFIFSVVLFAFVISGGVAAYNKSNLIDIENDSIVIKNIPGKDSLKHIYIFNKTEENLIVNGDFEKGNRYFFSSLNYSTQQVSPGNYAVTNNASKHNLAFASVSDHTSGTGNYLLIDASPEVNSKTWCSKVKVDPQFEYIFSFFVSNINLKYSMPANIIVSINGKQIGDEISLPGDSHEWIECKWKWHSENNKDSIDFCIQDLEAVAEGNDYAIDDIVLYKISKPIEVPKEICPSPGDTLSPAVHFPFDESTITEFSKEKLKLLSVMLNECPKMKIKILGHTDMFGTDTYNNNLSAKRAKSIFDYLNNNGIASDRMSIEAKGESQILYHGKSVKDNVKNRRVRFVVSGFSE